MTTESNRNAPMVVFGVFLVVLGIILFGFQFWDIDIIGLGWPLFVIIPGLLFFVGMMAGGRQPGLSYLAVPGSVITSVGLLLAYQAITGDWQSWSYAWGLVAPGAVGLGLLIAGTREGEPNVRRTGAWLLGLGLLFTLVGEWVFVRVIGVGGNGFGPAVESVLPAGLIIAGLFVVFGRGRRKE